MPHLKRDAVCLEKDLINFRFLVMVRVDSLVYWFTRFDLDFLRDGRLLRDYRVHFPPLLTTSLRILSNCQVETHSCIKLSIWFMRFLLDSRRCSLHLSANIGLRRSSPVLT